jgi:FkbM family methyltransferase
MTVSYGEFREKAPVALRDYEKTEFIGEVKLRGIDTKFFILNTMTAWRASTILTKEPHTIEWLDTINANDILYDIGANIGIYSVYAAQVRKSQVFAFEPESSNYFVLNKNILVNNLHDRCTAFPVAVSNINKLSHLFMANMRVGDSNHSAGLPVRFDLNEMKYRYRQGAVLMTLDSIISSFDLPLPTHLKVDVDGLEHFVIDGAKIVFASKALRSILIELNTNLDEHRNVIKILKNFGFIYDDSQVDLAIKKSGWNKGLAEHIFTRC